MGFLHRHRGLTPYLLLAPGVLWLAAFFLVPLGFLAYQSLESGSLDVGYAFTWTWSNYSDAISDYGDEFLRSLEYAAIATGLALVLSYPVAYWIAFRGGRWKNLLLLAIVAPFFVTYLIRTLAWESILSDHGIVANTLRSLHLLGENGRLLATAVAVVCGITYNFLPFMALPLYVSLEQIDKRMIEAAHDLYASSLKTFLRVTLPLSLPGVVAGTLLTFIPAAGDFINAELLGSPNNHMIGNVIQSKFLQLNDYPAAAAMSFVADGRDPDRDPDLCPGGRHRAAHGVGRAVSRPRVSARPRRSALATVWAFVRRHVLTAYSILFFIYLMLPIAVVVVFSFNNPAGASTTPGRASPGTTGATGTASRESAARSFSLSRSR